MPISSSVKGYESFVANLLESLPIEEAMEVAVGGNYKEVGMIEAKLLTELGLKPGMSILDLGCGSGRLSSQLYQSMENLDYTGIDIVKKLLEYAKSKAPNYQFLLSQGLRLPIESDSLDMICAFSLFTHLPHAETFIYLHESLRTLKPGGLLVFSFIEFAEPGHWHVFETTIESSINDSMTHTNVFIERNAIKLWAEKIGLELKGFVDAGQPLMDDKPLGQSIAILVKPNK